MAATFGGGAGCQACVTVIPALKMSPSTNPRFITRLPVRNTRSMNQYSPARITPIEPASATRAASRSLCRRTSASVEATTLTIASWPTSTPRLKANSDHPSAACGRPNSFSTDAKPKPWIRPNTAASQARISVAWP